MSHFLKLTYRICIGPDHSEKPAEQVGLYSCRVQGDLSRPALEYNDLCTCDNNKTAGSKPV